MTTFKQEIDPAIVTAFMSVSNALSLKTQWYGKPLSTVPTPAAVIDRAKARQNCELMLSTATTLGVQFRAHVKSHKVRFGSYKALKWF